MDPASPILLDLLQRLPDITQLGQENVMLKKQIFELQERVHSLESENSQLKRQMTSLETKCRIANMNTRESSPEPRKLRHSARPHFTPSPPSPPPPTFEDDTFAPPPDLSDNDDLLFDLNMPPVQRPIKQKLASVLPARPTIASVVQSITRTEPEMVHLITREVLSAKFPSMQAMKKFCIDLMNTVFATILASNRQSDELSSLVTFLVLFAKQTSWIVYENFMERIAGDPELKSIALTYAEIADMS
jgi:hypothetical protein